MRSQNHSALPQSKLTSVTSKNKLRPARSEKYCLARAACAVKESETEKNEEERHILLLQDYLQDFRINIGLFLRSYFYNFDVIAHT